MSGTLVMELQKKALGLGVVERALVRSGHVPTPPFSPHTTQEWGLLRLGRSTKPTEQR